MMLEVLNLSKEKTILKLLPTVKNCQLCQELSQIRPALGPPLSMTAQNRATLGALLSRVTTYYYSGPTLSNVKSDLIRL